MRVTKVMKVRIKNPLFFKNMIILGFNFCNVTYVISVVTLVFRTLVHIDTLRKFKTLRNSLFLVKELLKHLNFRINFELHKLRKEPNP